jgi:hypothetical protein
VRLVSIFCIMRRTEHRVIGDTHDHRRVFTTGGSRSVRRNLDAAKAVVAPIDKVVW